MCACESSTAASVPGSTGGACQLRAQLAQALEHAAFHQESGPVRGKQELRAGDGTGGAEERERGAHAGNSNASTEVPSHPEATSRAMSRRDSSVLTSCSDIRVAGCLGTNRVQQSAS